MNSRYSHQCFQKRSLYPHRRRDVVAGATGNEKSLTRLAEYRRHGVSPPWRWSLPLDRRSADSSPASKADIDTSPYKSQTEMSPLSATTIKTSFYPATPQAVSLPGITSRMAIVSALLPRARLSWGYRRINVIIAAATKHGGSVRSSPRIAAPLLSPPFDVIVTAYRPL